MRVSIVPRYFCVTKGLTAALIEQLHGVGRDGETLANVGIATKNAVDVVGERAELILVDSVLGAGASSALDGDTTLVGLETAYVSSIGQLFRSHSPRKGLPALAATAPSKISVYSHRMRLVVTEERVELNPVLNLETARCIDVDRLHSLTSLNVSSIATCSSIVPLTVS